MTVNGIFSSLEQKVLKVNYCDLPVSAVHCQQFLQMTSPPKPLGQFQNNLTQMDTGLTQKDTGCNLKTMELFDCALIAVCVVIRLNTVCSSYASLPKLLKWFCLVEQNGKTFDISSKASGSISKQFNRNVPLMPFLPKLLNGFSRLKKMAAKANK